MSDIIRYKVIIKYLFTGIYQTLGTIGVFLTKFFVEILSAAI